MPRSMPPACEGSSRGDDCNFNEGMYSTFTAVLWILTALPLLAWAMPCLRRGWNASGPARASLLLAALSAACCFADDVFKVNVVGYGNQTLWSVGSIFLVFSVCTFATQWCTVASALLSVHKQGQDGQELIGRVRLTYKWMTLLHIPFAVMYSLHDYDNIRGPIGQAMMNIWGAWLVIGTIGVLSGLACVQFYISRRCLVGIEGARSLQDTALINLVEQLFFDMLVVIYVALYMSDNKNDGSNIAAYHAVGFITYWLMHSQVVLFFSVLGNTDPLYDEENMNNLLMQVESTTDKIPASTMGSPSTKGQDCE